MNIKVAAFTVSEKSSNTGVYKQDNRQDNKDKIIDKITANTLNSLPTCFFCCLLIFSKSIPSECQTVWIQIRPNKISGLIWVQTLRKSYQKTTLQYVKSYQDYNLNRTPNCPPPRGTGVYYTCTTLLDHQSM